MYSSKSEIECLASLRLWHERLVLVHMAASQAWTSVGWSKESTYVVTSSFRTFALAPSMENVTELQFRSQPSPVHPPFSTLCTPMSLDRSTSCRLADHLNSSAVLTPIRNVRPCTLCETSLEALSAFRSIRSTLEPTREIKCSLCFTTNSAQAQQDSKLFALTTEASICSMSSRSIFLTTALNTSSRLPILQSRMGLPSE